MPGAFGLAGAPALKFELTAVDRTAAAFAKVQRNLSLTTERMTLVNRSAQGIFGGKLLGGLGGGLLVASFVDPIGQAKEALEEFSRIANEAKSTGLSTDFYQTLGAAALTMGINQESLNSSLAQFTLRMGQARAGQGEIVAGYKTLNPVLLENLRNSADQEAALRLVANAVARATTAEEKRRIAQVAFGKSSADVVRLLDLGGQGIDAWIVKAKEMGLVIDRDLIARADELDAELNVVSRALHLQFAAAMVDIAPLMVEFLNDMRNMTKSIGETIDRAKEWYRLWQRIRGDVSGIDLGLTPGEKKGFSVALQPRTASPSPKPIPDAKADQAAKRLKETILDLRLEAEMLGLSSREQAVYNAHKQAGLDPTKQFNAELAASAELAFDAKQKFESLDQAVGAFGGLAFDAFDSLILKGEDLSEVLDDLADALIKMVFQAALLGQGPLAGLLGTAPTGGASTGGLLGALFGGARAGGGDVSAGRAYLVGEKGPELFFPGRSGTISQNGGGGSQDLNIKIINPPGVPQAATQRRGSNGEIEIVLEQQMTKIARRQGPFSRALSQSNFVTQRG